MFEIHLGVIGLQNVASNNWEVLEVRKLRQDDL